jgi:hypothetical protein
MDVRMPDGTIITGVPDNITQADLLARYSRFSAAAPAPTARKPATGPDMAVDPMGNFTGMEEQPVAQPQGLAAIAPKQTSEFAPGEEFGKGLGAGVVGLKSMWENAGVMKDVGALGTVQKRLDLFGKIDAGEIDNFDQLRGLDLTTSQARSYLGASPEMRETMKERVTGEIGRRQDFVKSSIDTLAKYQEEMKQYKGRTTDLTDVEGVKDFANWLSYNVGSGAVQLAPIMIAAATTGPAGVAALGTSMGVSEAVGNRMQALAPKLEGLNPDQKAAAVIDYVTKTGDTSLAVGIVSGAFDTILGPAATLAKRGLSQVVKGETRTEALKAGIKELPKQAGEEFITGGAQEATQIAGAVREGEVDEFLTKENAKKILNAAAAEAAGSLGGTGATTAARVYGAGRAESAKEKALGEAFNVPGGEERKPYVKPEATDLESLARSKGFLQSQPRTASDLATELAKPPAVDRQAVPESESQDTDAMMAELEAQLEGKPAPAKAEAPEPDVKQPLTTEPVEEPTVTTVQTEEAKPEPAAEPAAKTEAEYQQDIRNGMKSIDAVRDKRITQEQYEEFQALAQTARQELNKLQSEQAATMSPFQQEAIQIAERMEALGEKNFTAGVRNAARNPSVERNLPFYREKLADLESKRGATEQAFSETHSLKDLMRIESDRGLEKLERYQKTAAPATRAAVERVGEVVQQIKDAINSAGYAVNDIGASSPYELQNLKDFHSILEADITQILTQHSKLDSGHKISSQEAIDKRINVAKADINKASQELRRYAQLSPEIREQEEVITGAKRAAEKTARESGSLWGALTGRLDQSEVRDIFSANPNFGQKRLQIKGGKKVTGAQVSDIVADGGLDQFLPPDMRHDSPTFDEKESTDLIKQKIREEDYLPFDTKIEIEQIFGSVQEAEKLVDEFLTIEEQNLELQTAADEQRESEINAQEVEPGVESRAAEPDERAPLELTAPTEDELKAKQAEVDRLTKENERLSKQAEAKAKADAERDEFVLTGSDRASDVAAAQGQQDIFGAAETTPAEFTPLQGEDGKPVVVYRGSLGTEKDALTPTNFFGSGFFGKGINLTSSPEDASKYASPDAEVNIDLPGRASIMADTLGIDYNEAKEELTKNGGKVYPLFVSINNPLVIGQEKIIVPEKVLRLALAESNFEGSDADADRFVRQFTQAEDGVAQFQTIVNNKASTIYRQIASLQNKDGLIIQPEVAPKSKGATHYLVFDKDQVKSIFEGQEQPKQETKPNTVTTPDGAVLRYPVAVDMVKNGYQVLALDNPRTYVDKGGTPHRTFEKGPLRISMTPQRVLFQNRNSVGVAFGESNEMTIEALLVDTDKRNQGLATQAMQDVVDAADKNGVTLYLEPTPIVNLKNKDVGPDRSQLETFYNKFGFEFSPDADRVMQREPQAEVLPAEEPQIAGQIENEPYTFEGEFTEIGEEEQRTLITDQTSKLSDAQTATLEKFYGFARDSQEFADAVRQDVVNFITKGATYVNGKIRAIIRSISNGVLSVAVAFNPQFVSQPYTIAVPQYETRLEQVMQQVPAEVQGQMSEDAKRAYATIYPAIKGEITKNDKFFIVADKQTANMFVFNPDGSPFMASKTLIGAGIGDFIKGNNNIVSNRITPAGLFDLGLRDAKRSVDEAATAGEYDFGKVFVLDKSQKGANGFYSTTIMHSVWTKETDAKQRLAALQKPGAADSRYSFGCINVDKATYGNLVANNLAQMDGAKIFIVPENGKDVMSFVNGEATYSTDIIRQRAEPVTKETKVEVERAAPKAEADRTVAAKEEEGPVLNSVEAETAGWSPARIDQLINEFGYSDGRTFGMAGYVNPADFVRATTPTAEAAEMLSEEAGQLDAEAIRAQRQTPFLFWDIDKGVILDHEGRHRMAALARAGVTRAPVVLVVRDRYGSKKPDKYTPRDSVFLSGQGFQDGKGQGIGVNTLVPLSYEYKEQLGQDFGKTGFLYSLNPEKLFTSAFDEERQRSPSFRRRMDKLNRDRLAGKITDEAFINEADWALKQSEKIRLSKEVPEKKRGYLELVNRLSDAAKNGDISLESFELATWFMRNNPSLVEDLGVRILGKGKDGVGGQYSTFNRVMILIKGGGSNLTVVHEILHHLERMMPAKVQQAIRKAWGKQLLSAQKKAKTPADQLYFKLLVDGHYGQNNFDFIDIPEGEMSKVFMKAFAELDFNKPGSKSSFELAEILLKNSLVPIENYQYFNPSEFWAVNGSEIVKGRFDAVQGGVLARLKNWLKELGQKIKGFVGMNSNASIIKALDSLSKADGTFVTNEMLGEGEYKNIRRNFEGNEAPAASWESPEESKMDNWIYKLQDKLIDTKRVIEGIKKTSGQIADNWDVYLKEELFHGRAAKRTQDFMNREMLPILEEMKEKGVTLEQFEKYLHMRHAEERNAFIAKRNPKMQDQGSGVTNAEAAKYLANLSDEQNKTFGSLAKKFDKIIDGTQKLLVEGGLETQDTIDAWNGAYEHYVPLMRDDLDFKHHGKGLGSGYSTRGSSTKSAFGSTKKVIDIFANVALQRERAIVRSEKARIGRALYGLVIKNPNPGFWLPINPDAIKDKEKLIQELQSLGMSAEDAENIIQEPKVATIDKKTGLVKYQVNPLMRNSDNVFPVRINGEDRYIFFNTSDERAIRMVEALKNLDAEQMGVFMGAIGSVTRWMAAVNTQYNPVFGLWNFTRDVQGAAFNLTTTEIAGSEKKVLDGVLPALKGIYTDLRQNRKKSVGDSEWAKLFEQYELAGGQTGYRDQFSQTERRANIVKSEMEKLNQGNVRKVAQAMFDWLSDYNTAMENAVRLSAFKVALDQGMSEERAASLAKNLTVNFNRKGASSPTLQTLFAFFNAAVQGTARLAETLRGPSGKKIMAGGLAIGVAQAIALAMAGYDDDEPPEFLKNKNLIIPVPFTGNYLIIPMPLGFNVFPGVGRLTTEFVLGKAGLITGSKSAGDKLVSVGSLILDAFNPLGSGSVLQMVTPTVADPAFAIAANRDAFGRPISKEDRATAPTPGYSRSRETASWFSKQLAEFLNYVSSPSGTKYTKGLISPTADQIDYLIGQYTGGVGREILKAAQYGSAVVTGETGDVPSYKVPIAGKLFGETESPSAISAKFYDNVIRLAEHENEIKSRIKNKESATEYKAEHPETRFISRVNNLENQITAINKEKKELQAKDAPKERIKRLDERKTKLMKDFNDKIKNLERQ